ncbi:MAG: MaoC family dehydratase N-terminal domain-containing protein [Acidobacteria bacterium]|nr:MaoC family dehydratase N-terminal domain-containing protein [Acidobacteriota bacterium]
MPIDIEKALGATLEGPVYSWTDDDVILYHLGIGAGSDPVDPDELRYVYEGDLQVLPTYATIPPFEMMMSFAFVDGLDINLAQVLHGEQETILHDRIPTSGAVTNEGTVTNIFDKGKGALVVMEIVSRLESTGEPLFTNRSSIYIKGEGGFGGDSGPSTSIEIPDREPEHVVQSATLPQQALLYRISSGDKNPLHADPGFAAFAGYERPILHGLCTYGIVAKAVADSVFEGQAGDIASYRSRFSGHVFPGETIVSRIWDEGDRVLVVAETQERGLPVITNAVITRR